MPIEDKELLSFVYERCETRAEYLSKQIEITHTKLWCIENYNYRFTNKELDILFTYLKKKKGYKESYINHRLKKCRIRNNINIKAGQNEYIKGDCRI
jgi:hypothetical protein